MVHQLPPTVGDLMRKFAVELSLLMLYKLIRDPAIRRGVLLVSRGVARRCHNRRVLSCTSRKERGQIS